MNRVILLDLLRFLAALAVVLYHYTFDGSMSNYMTTVNFQEIGSVFKYGHLGVELFFMISGFVILLSIEGKSISHFIISRVTRLYPAYWAGVTLTAIVIAIYGGDIFNVSLLQYLYNLTMIQEGFQVRNIDGVYWTLFVEIRFYFLIFLLMLFRQIKFIKFYLLAWVTISILYHFMTLPNLVNFFLISNVAPFFIAGSIFYMAYRDKKFVVLDYVILLVSFISAMMYLNQHTLSMEKAFSHSFNMSIIMVIVLCYYLSFFAISKHKMVIKKDKEIFIIMGAVTYPLYLIHKNIGFIIFNNLSIYINKYILLISTISFMLILAYVLHITVEKKLGKYMKRNMSLWSEKFINRLQKNE